MRPKLWRFERMAADMGYRVVAGVDEVGMGPLAGPVVGGAVVLRIGDRIPGLNDSKQMTAEEREQVDRIIRRRAVAVSVCAVDHTQVDRLGLYKARILAKVARDATMIEYDRLYPGWGFADHKGYATPSHRAAIRRLGPSPIHRTSWAPFRVSELAGSGL